MKPFRITNIQRGCVYDGPGVRTTVFLKGCTLKCPWCCNPETISFDEQWFVDDDKCLFKQGIQSKLCEPCERLNGLVSIHECPFGISEKTSKDYSVEELYDELIKDIDLYKETGGGVTFSGGEPLLYSEELVPLLKALKSSGVNVAMETTLMANEKYIEIVNPYIDSYIVDLKLQPQMCLYDDSYVQRIKLNRSLIKDNKMLYRLVFVNLLYDKKNDVKRKLLSLNVNILEVLVCHNLGKKKYDRLSIKNEDYTADSELATKLVEFLKTSITKISILTI